MESEQNPQDEKPEESQQGSASGDGERLPDANTVDLPQEDPASTNPSRNRTSWKRVKTRTIRSEGAESNTRVSGTAPELTR